MIEPPLTSASTPCPETEAIRVYAAGGFDQQRAEQLETHLLSCTQCETMLDAFDDPSDAIIQALGTLPMSPDDEAAYQDLRKSILAKPIEFANSAEATAQLQRASRLADPDLGPLPCRLGSYELIACIGRGASGAVYRARHLKLDQTVAVKVLDSSRSFAPDSFLQEMKTIGSLAHPHIVRATDAGEEDGLHFLVMEYIEGIDAARLLFRHGPLRVADACEIARQATLGLKFVHDQSLVHRDIKPSNLLVTVDGQVKLLDLGIATRSDQPRSDQDGPTHGEAAKPLGTYDYMAPEQWTNPVTIDPRTDLYSLGCTLFKLLTATTPPKDSVIDSASLNKGPRSIQRLLQSLLSVDPELRPSSVDAVIDTLRPCCRGANLPKLVGEASPALAAAVRHQDTASTRQKQFPLSRRAAVAGLAAAGAAALVLPKLTYFSSPTLKRVEWRPLVPVEPTIIIASGDPSTVEIRAEQQGEYELTSEDLALIHMGRPVNGLFSMAVDIVPNELPNCGIFFKGQFDYFQPNRTFRFQSVEFFSVNEQQPSTREYHLLWSQWSAVRIGNSSDTTQTPLAEVLVKLAPNEAAQSLKATCGRQGMPEIEWNGQPLHESMWQLSSEGRALQRLSTGLLPTAYLGRLGLISTNGTTTFQQPRLVYL